MQVRRLNVAVAVAATVALAVAGCAQSKRSSSSETGDTLVFAAAGAPKNFDPIFNDDGESFRPIRQMYETLIDHKPGTAELTPGLAESWDHNADGTEWTFHLRKGIQFHDGTPFDAKAVCANFDRWFNMPGAAAQSQMLYYTDVFGGFAKNAAEGAGEPVYKTCTAKDDATPVVTLNRFKGAFPAAFTLTSLSMVSPNAVAQFKGNEVTQQGDSFSYSEFANAHPVGTGPFKFSAYDKANNTITLVRNDSYWGNKAKLKKLIFKIIPDENARKQELRAGTVDGYDFPSPSDYDALRKDGFNVELRKAFNILYLGLNQKNPKLKDLRVRQAIAYAINREELGRTKFPDGTKVANEFYPDTVLGYAQDVQKYEYDVDKAKQLLKEAGATGMTLKFYYPTEVSRPYMPDPQGIFTVVANDLQAAGFKIEPHPEPWNGGYKDSVQQAGKQDLHLLGWTGDYNDPGNFIGTFFGRAKVEFGDQAVTDMFAALTKADATVDEAGKKAAYEQVNRDLMSKWLPAIPLVHSPPAIVVSSKVKGLVPSPLTNEEFASVSITK